MPDLDQTAAVLTSLVRLNVPPDVQELLTFGNARLGVPPGSLDRALKASRVKAMATAGKDVDRILQGLADSSRNAALETAAKMAETHGESILADKIRALKVRS
ncbi:MAG: hypothetical protein KIT48_09310 [Pseudolabrys sp.]|nr:hypothetical protein [Pseudolabrys sp.]